MLSLPPRWLGMYSDFITKNSSAVSQIESALRSLTYIIPGTPRASHIKRNAVLGHELIDVRALSGIRNRLRIMYVLR